MLRREMVYLQLALGGRGIPVTWNPIRPELAQRLEYN